MANFKVEALSLVNTIHRAVTLADTREKAHATLKDYHDARFQSAAKKMRKANARAAQYAEGSQKHQQYTAIANSHLGEAQKHNQLYAHHAQAEHNTSVAGYEHNENMNKRMNIMAFNHQVAKEQNKADKPAAPTVTRPLAVTPTKGPVLPTAPKIVTPKPVKNVATPLENSLAPNPVKPPAPIKTKNRLGRRSNLPNGGKKPKRIPGPGKKPSIKAKPVSPTPAPKPIKLPTIKAKPIKPPKPIKMA